MPEKPNPTRTLAASLLHELRGLFDQTTCGLAQACAVQGRLDATCFDAAQVACYELAWASAELLASETVLEVMPRDTPENNFSCDVGSLDADLALIFVTDAIAHVLQRLEAINLELGWPLAPLQRFSARAEWAALRRAATSASALNRAGGAFARAPENIGPVELSETLVLAQDAFRRFAAEVVAPVAQDIHHQDLTVPEALLQPLREMGVFGLSIPEQFGGSAPNDRDDTLMMVVVTEALSEASLGAAGSLITRPEILSRALMTGGSAAQKALWLPRLASGDTLCAIAITEPDFGSDVAGLLFSGTPVAGGWLLNGAKTWCTFAGKAQVLMVVTRTHPDKALGHRGLSLMLVEKPSFEGHTFDFTQPGGGRVSGKAIRTIGYRGMHSFDVSFDNFFVPSSHLIGEQSGVGKGFYFTMAGMVGGRMQTAARSLGVMRAALLAALRHAQSRKVFGAPLIDTPLTLAKLARMAARYAASRQLTYAIGRALDAGGAREQASLVKLLACRSAEIVTREALQIHGGLGYAEESPVSRYFVDARVLSIFEGAEETLALKVIARGLLETALLTP